MWESQTDSTELSETRAVLSQDVEQWIKDNGCKTEYINAKIPTIPQQSEWLENVHGAKLLKDIFNNLSDNSVCFDKVKHGVLLTEWIIKNAPSDLNEVSELIQNITAQLPTNKLTA